MSSVSDFLKGILKDAEDAYVNITYTRYTAAIGVTILCYDTLLTLPDEVRLVWGSRWGATKFLYYLNRIISFFFLLLNSWHLSGYRPPLSNLLCEGIVLSTAYGAIICFGIANWMLLLRVSALYGHNRMIYWGLAIFFTLSYIATFITMSLTAIALHGKITYSPVFHICTISSRPSTLAAVWVSPITFEVVTFSMSIYKIWSHARKGGDLTSNRLLRLLYRDGVLYFVVIMGFRVFNLICWLILPTSLVFVGVFLLWALIIVLIGRLFLNLRSLNNPHEADWEGEGYYSTETKELYWRSHAQPLASRSRGQSTNIFGGGTMIRGDDRFSLAVPPTASLPVARIGIQVTTIEERWSRPLDNRWAGLAGGAATGTTANPKDNKTVQMYEMQNYSYSDQKMDTPLTPPEYTYDDRRRQQQPGLPKRGPSYRVPVPKTRSAHPPASSDADSDPSDWGDRSEKKDRPFSAYHGGYAV